MHLGPVGNLTASASLVPGLMALLHHPHISPPCLEEQGLAQTHVPGPRAPLGSRKREGSHSWLPSSSHPLSCLSTPLNLISSSLLPISHPARQQSQAQQWLCLLLPQAAPNLLSSKFLHSLYKHSRVGTSILTSPVRKPQSKQLFKESNAAKCSERNLRAEVAFLWIYMA